jgi:hypothetical protein
VTFRKFRVIVKIRIREKGDGNVSKTLKLTENEVASLKTVLNKYLATAKEFKNSNNDVLRELYEDVERIWEYLHY